MPDPQRDRSRRPYLAAGGLLALAIIAGLLVINHNAVSAALKPYFTREPDPLTELYFTDYGALHKFMNAGKGYPLDFTVVNHENGGHTYSYRVTAVEDSATTVLASGRMTLPDGGRSQKKLIYRPKKPGAAVRITVELVDLSQSITFNGQINFS